MQEHNYLLFGEGRWALDQHYIMRVDSVDEESSAAAVSLDALGIQTPDGEWSGHVLRLETPSFQLSLLVYGQLKSIKVDSQQVIELPLQFFESSPAVALIVRDDHQVPAMLLEPDRLRARLIATGEEP